MIFLFFSPCVLALEKLDAHEWAGVSHQRKIYFVLDSMEIFQNQGIVFTHTMDEYIQWMDEASKSASDGMDVIFSHLVATHEPEPSKPIRP